MRIKSLDYEFSKREIAFMIIIVLLVALSGGYAWRLSSKDKQIAEAEITSFASCVAAGNPVMESFPEQCSANGQTFTNTASQQGTLDTLIQCDSEEWKVVSGSTVKLDYYRVMLELPTSLEGKAVCRRSTDGIADFSLAAVVNNQKCVDYYKTAELISEGIAISRNNLATPAGGHILNEPGTLQEYYEKNKTAGNYFIEPVNQRKFYKVGEYFYVAFGDTAADLRDTSEARKKNCDGVDPAFRQVFVDALSTLRSY